MWISSIIMSLSTFISNKPYLLLNERCQCIKSLEQSGIKLTSIPCYGTHSIAIHIKKKENRKVWKQVLTIEIQFFSSSLMIIIKYTEAFKKKIGFYSDDFTEKIDFYLIHERKKTFFFVYHVDSKEKRKKKTCKKKRRAKSKQTFSLDWCW